MNDIQQQIAIGAGKHLRRSHLSYLAEHDIKTVSLFDPNYSSQSAVAGTQCLTHASLEAALQTRGSAVWIGSPDSMHCEQLEAAVNAGKHVFVEKPLATSAEELRRVVEALYLAESKGLTVLTCHPRRMDPPYLWLKDILPQLTSRLGPVLAFQFDLSYPRLSQDWKRERSLLLDHASHEIDLVNFLFGTSAITAHKVFSSPERYHIVARRDDGLSISFHGSRFLHEANYLETSQLRFERGEAVLRARSGECSVYDHNSQKEELLRVPATSYQERDRAVTSNFIKSTRARAKPYLTTKEMLFAAEFATALDPSHGQEIRVANNACPVELLEVQTNVPWLPKDSIVRHLKVVAPPPRELTTSALALCFSGEDILMVKHDTRSWDFPGGHLESHESALAGVQRETREEACAELKDPRLFALIEVTTPVGAERNPRYPSPRSYMVVYLSQIEALMPFKREFETSERRLFDPVEARRLPAIQRNRGLYESALSEVRALLEPSARL